MAALEISPNKVGYVIVKAREVAAKVASWDDGATSDHDADSILESFSDDATQDELKGFIHDLNEDEQASLVALAWIGRGLVRGRRNSMRRWQPRAPSTPTAPKTICSACRSLPTISRKGSTGSAIRSRTPRTTLL